MHTSIQQISIFVMKRLVRRSRSAARVQSDGATRWMSCLPSGSLLCGGLPPSSPSAVEASITSWLTDRWIEINHDNHASSKNDQQRIKKNSIANGDSGPMNYDRFIATLLREQSIIKDGIPLTAAVHRQPPPVNRPRPLTRRVRKRRPSSTTKTGDKPRINGDDSSRSVAEATGVVNKIADDQLLLLKSAGVEFTDTNHWTSINSLPACRPRDKLDIPRSMMNTMEADIVRRTPTKLDQRSKRRRRRYRMKDQCQGGTLNDGTYTTHYRSDVTCDTDNYKTSRTIASATFGDRKTELEIPVDKTSNRYQGQGDSCAFRNRFDGYDTEISRTRARQKCRRGAAVEPQFSTRIDKVTVDQPQGRRGLDDVFSPSDAVTLHDSNCIDNEMICRNAVTVFSDSEPEFSTPFDKGIVGGRSEGAVFGLNVEESTIQFIDCDEPFHYCILEVDCSSSMTDRRVNVERSSLSLCSSAVQFDHNVTGAASDDRLMCCCAVCQRSSPSASLRHRHSQSQPSLTQPPADRTSPEPSCHLARRPRDRGVLAERCRCSITLPRNAGPDVMATENTDDDKCRSLRLVHGPVSLNDTVTENISACCANNITVIERDVIGDVSQRVESGQSCASSLRPSSVDCASGDLVSSSIDAAYTDGVDDVTPCTIDDVSQSLMLYEFAEVTSVFRNFADDLLPITDDGQSLTPYKPARQSTSTALVLRAGPGVTYSGAVVPYESPRSLVGLLPLMTWTWRQNAVTGSRPRTTNYDVTHIPHISACKTVNAELPVDHLTLISSSMLTRVTKR